MIKTEREELYHIHKSKERDTMAQDGGKNRNPHEGIMQHI